MFHWQQVEPPVRCGAWMDRMCLHGRLHGRLPAYRFLMLSQDSSEQQHVDLWLDNAAMTIYYVSNTPLLWGISNIGERSWSVAHVTEQLSPSGGWATSPEDFSMCQSQVPFWVVDMGTFQSVFTLNLTACKQELCDRNDWQSFFFFRVKCMNLILMISMMFFFTFYIKHTCEAFREMGNIWYSWANKCKCVLPG